ncbi:MAG: type II secretion system protein GspM [Oscillospiraceae bacterium]
MKLTKRDRTLLLIVIVGVMLAVGYMMFVSPAIKAYKASQKSYDSEQTQKAELESQVNAGANLKNDVNDAYQNALNEVKSFYPLMESYEVDGLIKDLFQRASKDSTLTIANNIEISDIAVAAVPVYLSGNAVIEIPLESDADIADDSSKADSSTADSASSKKDTKDKEDEELMLACYTITVGYTGSYEEVINFATNLTTKTEQSLILTNITINEINSTDAQSSDEVNGAMTFTLYMIPQIKNPGVS